MTTDKADTLSNTLSASQHEGASESSNYVEQSPNDRSILIDLDVREDWIAKDPRQYLEVAVIMILIFLSVVLAIVALA